MRFLVLFPIFELDPDLIWRHRSGNVETPCTLPASVKYESPRRISIELIDEVGVILSLEVQESNMLWIRHVLVIIATHLPISTSKYYREK